MPIPIGSWRKYPVGFGVTTEWGIYIPDKNDFYTSSLVCTGEDYHFELPHTDTWQGRVSRLHKVSMQTPCGVFIYHDFETIGWVARRDSNSIKVVCNDGRLANIPYGRTVLLAKWRLRCLDD